MHCLHPRLGSSSIRSGLSSIQLLTPCCRCCCRGRLSQVRAEGYDVSFPSLEIALRPPERVSAPPPARRKAQGAELDLVADILQERFAIVCQVVRCS